MTRDDLIALARLAAKAYNLDDALVCAIVEQESGWNPWAIRYEPLFMTKYVAPLYTSNKISATEAYARSFSWGLMQLMGQVARELGLPDGLPLARLCDPATGLDWGCKHFANRLAFAHGDTQHALLLWNGGGDASYAKEVLERVPKYILPDNHTDVQAAATGEN